jgi:lipooligosaccharide transport system permease protein
MKLKNKFSKSALKVWQRDFLFYKKTWVVSLMWTIFEPMMYLGAIGYGLGFYVQGIQGQSYPEFFFSGILCSTAMMVPFFEGTYSNFTKLTWQKTYSTILMTKISAEDVVLGELLWSASKGIFGVLGVSLVGLALGLVQNLHFVSALLILALTCWVFSCFAMCMTSLVKNYDQFVYFNSGLIVPMSLLCGVYFPVEQLPAFLKFIVWLLPLTYSTTALRLAFAGDYNLMFLICVLVLLAMGYLGLVVAIKRMRKKLIL